ncbi:MAG: DUF6745 domain-containing protein [Cyanobacteriota bacterium]
MYQIEKLTPEQEALIPVYREKWKQIGLSTERLDCERTVTAIKVAYTNSGEPEPEIVFCESPLAALKELRMRSLKYRHQQLYTHLVQQPRDHLKQRLDKRYSQELQNYLHTQLDPNLCHRFVGKLLTVLEEQLILLANSNSGTGKISAKLLLDNIIQPELWVRCASWFDYCASVLGLVQPQSKWELRWQILQNLLTNCGWLFPYDGICFVCKRPLSMRFDELGQPHAEAQPAIEFIDGLKLYAYHGAAIPEHYGAICPEQWRQRLLQEEVNPQLLSILLKGLQLDSIEQLTSEQEALIPVYEDKWQTIRLSSKPTNRQAATEAIKAAYELLSLPEPEMLFFSNPDTAIEYLRNHPDQNERRPLEQRSKRQSKTLCWEYLPDLLQSQLEAQLKENLQAKLGLNSRGGFELGCPFGVQLGHYFPISPPFWRRLWGEGSDLAIVQPGIWASRGASFDFCFMVLGCLHNLKVWQVFQVITQECGLIFPYEEKCIVCDRPIKILVDSHGHLHGEGEPALLFADGSRVYVHHGVRLPETIVSHDLINKTRSGFSCDK